MLPSIAVITGKVLKLGPNSHRYATPCLVACRLAHCRYEVVFHKETTDARDT